MTKGEIRVVVVFLIVLSTITLFILDIPNRIYYKFHPLEIFRSTGVDIKQTLDGGYIFVGYMFLPKVNHYETWLIKVNANGKVEWQRRNLGGTRANCLQMTRDGGYIIVGETWASLETKADFWILKIDSSGKEQWSRIFGGKDFDIGESIWQTDDDGYIICGSTQSFGAGYRDLWLIKIDATGQKEWDTTYGGKESDYGNGGLQAKDSGHVIVGETYSPENDNQNLWLVKINRNGNKLWEKTFNGTANDIRKTRDGGYILVGGIRSGGVWLLKIDAIGNEQWSKSFGHEAADYGQSLEQTTDGGYIILAITSTSDATRIIKVDEYGNKTWEKTYNGKGLSIEGTKDGGYIIVGYMPSFADKTLQSDVAWILKTDINGNKQWSESYMQK